MQDDEFEWDDLKAQSNLRKHGVSFEDARLVFVDPLSVDALDIGTYDENRATIVGTAKDRLLAVVYTERNGRIRIVSARRATKRECDDYYKNQTSA